MRQVNALQSYVRGPRVQQHSTTKVMHVHDAHFIRIVFGMPKSVVAQGRMRRNVVEYCNSLFTFEDPHLAVTATCGVINQQGRPFTHAYEIHLEKATLQFDFAAFTDAAELMPLKVVTSGGKVLRPNLGDGNPIAAFVAEIKEVASSIRSGRTSALLSAELARDAILLCHKQTESVKKGRAVKVS